MKTKIITALVFTFFATGYAFAESSYGDSSFFTGENFYQSPQFIENGKLLQDNETPSKESSTHGTIPPIKKLRMYVQKKSIENQEKRTQLAPTDPNASIYNSEKETSDFASKEVEENFDENMMPDGFEADAQSVEDNKKAKHFLSKNSKNDESAFNNDSEDIVLDCDDMDYDTDKYCLYATGNVNVEFVKQGTTVKADKITFDRMNNTIKAEGNVHIIKHGQVIDGDYIFVDMNEENALVENPITQTPIITIKARKGYVYGDKIVQENGSIDVTESYKIEFHPNERDKERARMIVPKSQTLTNDMNQKLVNVKAKELTITRKGDLEVLSIRHTDLKRGKYTILKIPALKVYTNKNHDYGETNIWELGSIRGLGMYTGPGFVFELPKGSVLKAIPILNYNHKFGFGAIGRFHSGTNYTQAAYGTANSLVVLKGEQKLDDNLFIHYAVNDYLDEWWLGHRRPKYGVSLVYRRNYSSRDFLLKDRVSSFEHMFDVGYFHDIDKDSYYNKLRSPQIGTLRTRYMAQASQNLFHRRNEEKQLAFDIDVVGAMSAALYGTGDTQIIGRIGPRLHTQWKRWMQDVGYFQSVYDDNTPLPVYDAYRYGKSNLYIREYFRLCKYLTLSWYGSINLSGDSYNDRLFQENLFYLSVGPDDVRFNIGYDPVRERTFFSVEMMMDIKGTHIDYDKLVIKNDGKTKNNNENESKQESEFKNSDKAPVLMHAQVEDIKNVEDVL